MQWSYYNTLFTSRRFGYFLYNSLSNTLFELDEEHYKFLEAIKRKELNLLNSKSKQDFIALLKLNKVLVENYDEGKILMIRQHQRNAFSYDNSHLGLTICPTLKCNFQCPYCFEHTQQDTSMMSNETIYQLLKFIKCYGNKKELSISWYGGEPTLAFDLICKITDQINQINVDFVGASLITNGYLLSKEYIDQLNDLNIKTIQITIDGSEKTHDKRRFLFGGKPTFNKIMSNINALMNSSYEGHCIIRSNIDKRNISDFLELRNMLLSRHKDKKLSVYAGHVIDPQDYKHSHSCNFSNKNWVSFIIQLYQESGILPRENFYPKINTTSTCVANKVNEFVIGPNGELYKCWEDVGKKQMEIGDIFGDNSINNFGLEALYSLGTDPYLDEECKKCKTLPICSEGCANKRLRSKYFKDKNIEFCSPYKDNLIPLLEEYYDHFMTKEICKNLLSPDIRSEKAAYRIIGTNCA